MINLLAGTVFLINVVLFFMESKSLLVGNCVFLDGLSIKIKIARLVNKLINITFSSVYIGYFICFDDGIARLFSSGLGITLTLIFGLNMLFNHYYLKI